MSRYKRASCTCSAAPLARGLKPAPARAPQARRPTRTSQAGATALLLAAAAWLSACSHITDRVVLLPQPDGQPSAVTVSRGAQQLVLNQPYAAAQLQGEQLAAVALTREQVQARYGAVLAQMPARPRVFVVRFESNGNKLTADAEPVLAELRAALAGLAAPEVVVTGHTDRVGSEEANDKLSLVRANAVREILVAAGVPREAITVAGRGEREPELPTADEVAEARNRRVEIKLR